MKLPPGRKKNIEWSCVWCGFLIVLPSKQRKLAREKRGGKIKIKKEKRTSSLPGQSGENNFKTNKTHTWDRTGSHKCSGVLVSCFGSHSGCPGRKWIVVNQFVADSRPESSQQQYGNYMGIFQSEWRKNGGTPPNNGLRFVTKVIQKFKAYLFGHHMISLKEHYISFL